jgi:hypothetical protein
VQSSGGCCLVVGDKLHFYIGGVSGKLPGWHPDATHVGLAVLRRDGFASLDAVADGGTITTRPVKFTGNRLFVNADAAKGELRVEVLDRDGKVLPPFTSDNCEAVRVDKTLVEVKWRGVEDLSRLSGSPVRFRFKLRDASLYSFWVSRDASGASYGYVGAGGPGFRGPRDDGK